MKLLFSALAIALTLYAFIPYIRSIIGGQVRPHLFSWIIWSICTLVVFAAQLSDHGGMGAWPIGVSGVLTLFITALAWRYRADTSITLSDWGFLIAALLALPLWYLTADPLWTVVILTAVDALGFGPTFRKAYSAPHSESPFFYFLVMVRNLASIVALEHYSSTTVLFPAVMTLACLALIAMIGLRRAQVSA